MSDIKSGQLKHVYLLYGEESYLIRQYLGNLKAALSAGDTINTAVFEGKDINPGAVIDLAETMPFFSDHRSIFISNSGFFKAKKKGKKNSAEEDKENSTEERDKKSDTDDSADSDTAGVSGDIGLLADYMASIPDTAYIVFSETTVDKRSRLYKQIVKYGHAAEFKRQKEDVLIRWVLSRLKREGKNITRPVMEQFLQKTGNDMDIIDKELEKLICYTMGRDVITSEDVEAICTTRVSDKIFDMVDAIADKQQERALNLYYDLLLLKESPFKILSLINRQFHVLMQLKSLSGQGFDNKTLAAKVKVPEFKIRRNLSQARRLTMEQLVGAVRDGIQAEEDIKTGRMKDQLAVELLLIKYSRS